MDASTSVLIVGSAQENTSNEIMGRDLAPNIATRERRNGIQIVPDQVRSNWPAMTRLPAIDRTLAKALDVRLP